MNQFSRSELLIGPEAMEKLHRSRVAVFGVGGVGGYVVEALARSGVGTLDLIDNDVVSLTNLNRQIIATHATLGMRKVDAAAERVRDICPEIQVNRHACFFLPENADTFDFTQYDYVVDAVDTVSAKIEIVLRAQAANVPVISSMGAGNKLDPSRFRVADIYQTKVCPLARAMRNLLKRKGVKKLKVVYSEEEAIQPLGEAEDAPEGRRATPGSMAFVPAAAGLILAGEVVRDLIGEVKQHGARA